MLLSPQRMLIAALCIALPVTYGTMMAKKAIEVELAYKRGQEVGANTVSVATTKAAQTTVAEVEAGEREAPVVSPEKAKIIDLCNRSASCRDRKR